MIGIAYLYVLWTWNTLRLRMSDPFRIGYPGNPCSLPLLNCIGRNLELTASHALPHLDPYYWGSSFKCGTCPHDIWEVSVTPALQRGIDPTCFLYYGLFCHTNVHCDSLPVSVIWANLTGKWGVFLFPPVRNISIMKSSSCSHESHWCLFPQIFISRLCRS